MAFPHSFISSFNFFFLLSVLQLSLAAEHAVSAAAASGGTLLSAAAAAAAAAADDQLIPASSRAVPGIDVKPAELASSTGSSSSAASQPFPLLSDNITVTTNSTAPPPPSALWSRKLAESPLPTNRAWLNLVLNQGSTPEYIHPYLIRSKDGAVSIGYPSRIAQPGSIVQSFTPDLTVTSTALSPASRHVVTSFDDLSVTLRFRKELAVPLVRGCPYVSFLFRGNSSTVRLSTIHAVLGLSSDQNLTKHAIAFNNGQKWLIYASNPLNLSSDLTVNHAYKGLVRVALLTGNDSNSEAILDKFKSSYPLHGHADVSVPFRVKYSWRRKGSGDLLMLSLPMHRDMMRNREGILRGLSYQSIDGELQGVVGDSWVLRENPISVSWYSMKAGMASNSASDNKTIADALRQDVQNLKPITTDSSYFYGKAVARAARMALIAEELGLELETIGTVRDYLEAALTPWLNGTFNGNGFLYDRIWGGLTTRNGAMDSGADFGFGLYNDHHYHLGYFSYAGAVLAKLNPSWGASYKPHLYTMVEDYMSFRHHHHHRHHNESLQPPPPPQQGNPDLENSVLSKNSSRHRAPFPRLRNFDLWVLHSWAAGLTEFGDGRNEESTSEAVNAYYAASLVGRVFGDKELVQTALTLAALEMRAARALWHVPSDSSLYEAEFVSENRMVGVVWANKRDSALWFAPPQRRECRVGIQVLPILPITELLFQDVGFVRELVNWTLPALMTTGSQSSATDAWKGFVYALQALYSPQQALSNTLTLSGYDDGQSLSNLLWWIFSRQ